MLNSIFASMKRVTRSFIISNIISSVILVLSIPLLTSSRAEISNGQQNLWKGIALLLILLLGFFIRVVKAREVANNGVGSLTIIERLFLGVIVVFGLAEIMNFSFISSIYFFGSHDADDTQFYTISLILISFIVLVYEWIMIFYKKSRDPSLWQKKWLNPLYSFYVGSVIGLSWDVMIVGANLELSIDMDNFWSEFFAAIMFAIVMVISAQRLFWFEIFLNSAGWKDNLKVIASLVLVLVCAIAPLFYV